MGFGTILIGIGMILIGISLYNIYSRIEKLEDAVHAIDEGKK